MKIKLLGLLILLSGFFFISCSDDDGEDNPVNTEGVDLYGVWYRDFVGTSGTYHIELSVSKDDKTMTFDYIDEDSTDFQCDFEKDKQFLTIKNFPGCDSDGEYGYATLEQDHDYLTFALRTDDCPKRQSLLVGQWIFIEEIVKPK